MTHSRSNGPTGGVVAFFVLACAITWLLDLKVVLATLRHVGPTPPAMMMAGLGAFGPTLAALVLAAPRKELRDVFGRWRTNPIWIPIALLTPGALHLVATLIEVALGGHPSHWFYPPVRPEHVAALLFFSLGEEFGWRGFAYPRLSRAHGPILASVVVGMVWTVWHLGMWFSPAGPPGLRALALGMVELVSASLVLAWMLERSQGSLAVAIAFHAGGHLDNTFRAPEGEVRLRVLRLLVLGIAAVLATRALTSRRDVVRAE